ncbi:alkyl hydroperoxide reductase/ Thiol specific antioxidant/ Malallergen [Richelia sinica FACHB-800]|uniref:thioredoxin-dependent peroxiredoxin n=2 Tax=Richelia TaxID=98443 RepID=A0A975T9I5_9NOST|nr:alkyl hydroperoxide reductase/ Thiol specific antioxidant/ Malallergen [Richelia sinica FACHB-800]
MLRVKILVDTMIHRRNFINIFFAVCFTFISWLHMTPSVEALGGILPTINQPAPEFTLPTNTGDGKISLSDFRGKWVVVYFYPKDFTSGCTLEARRFQQDLPKYLEKNTQILGISADDIDSHAEFCNSEGLKFPLLADTNGEVSKTYGSWIGFVSMRHSFIIDPQGILRDTFVKVNPVIHSQEVLTRLAELQSQPA